MNKEIMKRLPFAETNVEGIELWLDQMALEGLFLCDTAGTSWYFREGEPEAIRYRLDKVTEKGAMPSVEKRKAIRRRAGSICLHTRQCTISFRQRTRRQKNCTWTDLRKALSLSSYRQHSGRI